MVPAARSGVEFGRTDVPCGGAFDRQLCSEDWPWQQRNVGPASNSPILDALASGDGGDMSDEQVEAATGIEHIVVMRALRDLKQAEYGDCACSSMRTKWTTP